MPSNVTNFNIRDVWKNNMEEEFAKIRDIIENYPYVAMVSSIYFHGKICAQPHKLILIASGSHTFVVFIHLSDMCENEVAPDTINVWVVQKSYKF